MYNSYDQNFFNKAKQTVYKWWCIVYKPVYKLFHHGHWPEEKDPYYRTPEKTTEPVVSKDAATSMANQILANKQDNVDAILADAITKEQTAETSTEGNLPSEPDIDLSNVDQDALARANEIMARLAAEAAEDEAKKQAEIDAAKSKALEEERLASILKSTKVDISHFIEEGKASRKENLEA